MLRTIANHECICIFVDFSELFQLITTYKWFLLYYHILDFYVRDIQRYDEVINKIHNILIAFRIKMDLT